MKSFAWATVVLLAAHLSVASRSSAQCIDYGGYLHLDSSMEWPYDQFLGAGTVSGGYAYVADCERFYVLDTGETGRLAASRGHVFAGSFLDDWLAVRP